MATEKMTIADTWLQRIDKPMAAGGFDAGINKKAVKRMQESAVNILQEASPRCSDIYVFADGSGLWLKRQDDWYPADEELIAEVLGRCSGCDATDPDDCECDPYPEDDEVTIN
jgi:hypothetical protein